MSESIPVSPEALAWLQRLARARETGDGWDEDAPPDAYAYLTEIGMVERRSEAWRLSDIGWWAMGRLILEDEG